MRYAVDTFCRLYGGVLEFGHAYIAVAVAANSIPALLQIDDNKAHIDSIAGNLVDFFNSSS